MRNLSLVIFDLDGTLLNTISDLGCACNYALKNCGFPIHNIDEYPSMVGNGINQLIMRSLPEDEQNEQNVLKMREWFIPFYNQHNCDCTVPYDGVSEMLQWLKKNNYKLAVASNKYQTAAERIICHYFSNTFDVIFGERDGIPRKPNPQIINDIYEELNISTAKTCMYVGDSCVDIQLARNAGIPVAACTWGFVPEQELIKEKPDYIIHSTNEFIELITNY